MHDKLLEANAYVHLLQPRRQSRRSSLALVRLLCSPGRLLSCSLFLCAASQLNHRCTQVHDEHQAAGLQRDLQPRQHRVDRRGQEDGHLPQHVRRPQRLRHLLVSDPTSVPCPHAPGLCLHPTAQLHQRTCSYCRAYFARASHLPLQLLAVTHRAPRESKSSHGCQLSTVRLYRYNSTSYLDDMAWAATWMYVATGTITYLEDAYNYWTMHRNVSAASHVTFPHSVSANLSRTSDNQQSVGVIMRSCVQKQVAVVLPCNRADTAQCQLRTRQSANAECFLRRSAAGLRGGGPGRAAGVQLEPGLLGRHHAAGQAHQRRRLPPAGEASSRYLSALARAFAPTEISSLGRSVTVS